MRLHKLLIAAGIFAASVSTMALSATDPASQTYSPNAKANALYVEAQALLAKSDPRTGGTFENGRRAVALYEDAVKADPKFALAYLGMARAWLSQSYSNPGASSDTVVMPAVRSALDKAVAADPNLAEAHQLVAAVAYNLDYDWPKAEREYKRVLELSPNSAMAHVSYAGYLGSVGRFQEALEQTKAADAIVPTAMGDFVTARTYYNMHRYDDAIAWCQKSLAKQQNLATQFYLGLMYVAQDRFDKAIPVIEETTKEKNAGAVAGLAYAYAMKGDRAKAKEELDRLNARRDLGVPVAYRMAAVYLALGDKKEALDWLDKSYARNENWMAQLKVDPVMDPLRSDPRFQDLMKKMKFA